VRTIIDYRGRRNTIQNEKGKEKRRWKKMMNSTRMRQNCYMWAPLQKQKVVSGKVKKP